MLKSQRKKEIIWKFVSVLKSIEFNDLQKKKFIKLNNCCKNWNLATKNDNAKKRDSSYQNISLAR